MGRNKVLLVVVLIAIVVVAYFAFIHPPGGRDGAEGTIGAVDKYRDQQISDEDVVLNFEGDYESEYTIDNIISPEEMAALFDAPICRKSPTSCRDLDPGKGSVRRPRPDAGARLADRARHPDGTHLDVPAFLAPGADRYPQEDVFHHGSIRQAPVQEKSDHDGEVLGPGKDLP